MKFHSGKDKFKFNLEIHDLDDIYNLEELKENVCYFIAYCEIKKELYIKECRDNGNFVNNIEIYSKFNYKIEHKWMFISYNCDYNIDKFTEEFQKKIKFQRIRYTRFTLPEHLKIDEVRDKLNEYCNEIGSKLYNVSIKHFNISINQCNSLIRKRSRETNNSSDTEFEEPPKKKSRNNHMDTELNYNYRNNYKKKLKYYNIEIHNFNEEIFEKLNSNNTKIKIYMFIYGRISNNKYVLKVFNKYPSHPSVTSISIQIQKNFFKVGKRQNNIFDLNFKFAKIMITNEDFNINLKLKEFENILENDNICFKTKDKKSANWYISLDKDEVNLEEYFMKFFKKFTKLHKLDINFNCEKKDCIEMENDENIINTHQPEIISSQFIGKQRFGTRRLGLIQPNYSDNDNEDESEPVILDDIEVIDGADSEAEAEYESEDEYKDVIQSEDIPEQVQPYSNSYINSYMEKLRSDARSIEKELIEINEEREKLNEREKELIKKRDIIINNVYKSILEFP